MEWKGTTVFITGASTGIGEGLSLALAKKGAVLGLFARRGDLLESLSSKCAEFGGTARVFAGDVTDAAAVNEAVSKFRDEFGKIDILIANAGIGGSRHAKDIVVDDVRKVMEVNFMGSVNSVAAVLPKMIERGSGHLVAISSLAGFRGLPRSASYSASKGAMTNFFESVRLDTAELGIDVTIIQPGFIKTPLTSGRENKMPFLMELDDAIPYFINAIERKKRFSAFPWQLASFVRLGRIFPGWLYDKIATKRNYRE